MKLSKIVFMVWFIGSVNNFDMTKRNWNNVSSEEAAILITDMSKAGEKDNI